MYSVNVNLKLTRPPKIKDLDEVDETIDDNRDYKSFVFYQGWVSPYTHIRMLTISLLPAISF
jgi:hypothetical protein